MESLNTVILCIMDFLLGWLLHWPTDAVLFVIAIGSAAILTLVRPFTTNQEFLGRCSRDRKRLKALMKEAREQKNKEAFKRHRTTKGMVAWRTLKAEGYPLLVAIIPIALVATWCFQRLEFHAPRLGQPIELTAAFPASAVGDLVHIVPEEGLMARNGWIQEIEEIAGNDVPRGSATWVLLARDKPKQYTLRIRYKTNTYTRALRVGQQIYSAPVTFHDDRLSSIEVKMKPVKLFNVVPGIPAILFPPWLVAYLLITVPFVLILKRLLKIH